MIRDEFFVVDDYFFFDVSWEVEFEFVEVGMFEVKVDLGETHVLVTLEDEMEIVGDGLASNDARSEDRRILIKTHNIKSINYGHLMLSLIPTQIIKSANKYEISDYQFWKTSNFSFEFVRKFWYKLWYLLMIA